MTAGRPGERNVQLAQASLLIAAAGGMALSLAVTVLLGRRLQSGDFGFFALTSTVFLIARGLTDMGSGNVVARETAAGPGDERREIEALMGLRLVISLPLALACAGAALFQAPVSHAGVLAAAALAVPFTATSGLSVVFQLRQSQWAVALAVLGVQVLALGACAVLLGRGAPGWTFAAVVVAREGLVAAATWALAVGLLRYAPRPALARAEILRLVHMAFAFGVSALLFNLTFQGGLLLVRLLRPLDEVGAYAAASRLLGVVVPIPGVLMSPLVPVLAAAARDPAAFGRQSGGVLHLALGVGALVAVGGWMLAPAVIEAVYGGRFLSGALSAVVTFRWLSLAVGLSFGIEAIAISLLSERRERTLVNLAIALFLANAVACVVLLPRFGFAGAAGALAVAAALVTVAGVVVLRRASSAEWLGRSVLFLAPAIVLAPVLPLLSGPPLVRIAVAAALGCVALGLLFRLPGVAAFQREQALFAGAAGSRTIPP
jgi:O-antigen/teichoic acid export membrane protein